MPKVAAAFGALGSAFSVTGPFASEASEAPVGPFASARLIAAAAALRSCGAGAAATWGLEARRGRSRSGAPPPDIPERPPPLLPGRMRPMARLGPPPKPPSVFEAFPIDPCSPLAAVAGASTAGAGDFSSRADASPDLHALAAASGASSAHTRIAARLRAERRSIPLIATPLLARTEQARLPASQRTRVGRVTRWKGLRRRQKVPEAIALLLAILRARGAMCD